MNYRRKANLTLAAVFFLFVISTVLKLERPNLFLFRLLNFVLEAALVGGIADWFAVTALFQKPLGWPFHTALIPRNRNKVIQSVSGLVENDLLSLELIQNKLAEVSFISGICGWIEQNGGTDGLARLIFQYVEDKAGEIPPQAARFLGSKIKTGLKEASLLTEAFKLLQLLPVEDVLDYALEKLHESIGKSQVRASLYHILLKQKEAKETGSPFNRYLLGFIEKIDGLNLEEAAAVLQDQLGLALQDLKAFEHPLRRKIQTLLQESFSSPAHRSGSVSQAMLAQTLERWKEEILLELPWEETLQNFLSKTLAYLLNPQPTTQTIPGPVGQDSLLFSWLADGADHLWQSFLADSSLQNQLNLYIRSTLGRLVRAEHRLIGSIAQDTLEALSEDDLNAFIEGKAGNDLQWIRINGSLVGGFAGLILFFFLDFVYAPWITPLFHHLLRSL